MPTIKEWFAGRRGSIVSGLTGLASSTFGVVLNVVIVVIIGLYLAAQPGI